MLRGGLGVAEANAKTRPRSVERKPGTYTDLIISSSILALPEVALVVEVAVAVVMLRMEMMVHLIMRMSGRWKNSILFLFLAPMASHLPASKWQWRIKNVSK